MIKLVSVGNQFMKDDGIAIKVTEKLREKLIDKELDIIIAETDYQNCFYLLNEGDFVIILDAMYTGTEPGNVCVFDFKDVIAQPFGFFMQHDMSIIELMKLYNCKFKSCIVGIEIADVGFGDELSPVLKEKFPQICSKVESAIKKLISEDEDHARYFSKSESL